MDFLPTLQIPMKREPLFMEFPVNPESAPYLVSSTRTVVWIERSYNGMVRAAARKATSNQIMLELVRAIQKRGAEDQWGNAFPFTMDGVKEALAYLDYFGIHETDTEILLNPENDLWQEAGGPARTRISWLPPGLGLVVPLDRSFLGFQTYTPSHRLLALVHNPSRGVAILGE